MDKVNTLFEKTEPDFLGSPLTGISRQHWHDMAEIMLINAFSSVKDNEDILDLGDAHSARRTDKLEGFSRTLILAVPLLKLNGSLTINSIEIASYYRMHIENMVREGSATFIKPRSEKGGTSQELVEIGTLCMCLTVIPDLIWDPLSQKARNALAETFLSYGHGPTISSNWRFFNVFILSFLSQRGYAVNHGYLISCLKEAASDHVGGGWYRDGDKFDFYSIWGYQFYAWLWTGYYGDLCPEMLPVFQSNLLALSENFQHIFSRQGEMVMWGRSISYRFASTVPFFIMSSRIEHANHGWMRRISSGTLCQFFENPFFLKKPVPDLGFYGKFAPAVQYYSCNGSVLWMGKAFWNLLLDENDSYWKSEENDGDWNDQWSVGLKNLFLEKPEILITNYRDLGISEIRVTSEYGKKNAVEPFRGDENYNRLSYNTAFPWQADGPAGEVAMNYSFRYKDFPWETGRLFSFRGYRDGIFYRDLILESNTNISMALADIPISNGILRIDVNTGLEPVEMAIGHYSLPDHSGIQTKEILTDCGHKAKIIDNGEYQLAMVSVSGWDEGEFLMSKGLHPSAEKSCLIQVKASHKATKDHFKVYICLMLWKEAGLDWLDEELMPIASIKSGPSENSFLLEMKNGGSKHVDFSGAVRDILIFRTQR